MSLINNTVSVLVATYNGDKYIREQIESLLKQKNVNVKIIVRDDGSTDGTVEILNEYKEKKLLDWYSGEHLGVEKNFLDLLKHASDTEFYAFCDQDDVWDEEKLYVAIKHLKGLDLTKPALYFSGLKLVDSELNNISIHKVNTKRSDYARFVFSGIAGCTMVFNKVLTEECNKKEPAFLRMHDIWLFNVCMALGGGYYADTNSFINYRQHSSNVVGIKKKGWKSTYDNYVENSKVSKHIQSLIDCYNNDIIPEYRVLCNHLVSNNSSIKSRLFLFFNRKIDFGNMGLNAIFKLKIFLRKM